MKKAKFTLFGSLLAAAIAMPALANGLPGVGTSPFTTADAAMLFEQDGRPMQLAALSDKEMKETDGAVVPFAIGALAGGAVGGVGYAIGAYNGNHEWSTTSFVGNVATGALIGSTFGAAGYMASVGASFISSLTNAGANVWRFNSFTANQGVNQIWRNP